MQLKKMNRKIVLSVISIFFVIAIILISSLVSAGFDIRNIKTDEFISNMMITIAIVIFGVISGNGIGDTYYREKENGLFNTVYSEYETVRKSIDKIINKFNAWNKEFYKKQVKERKIKFLCIENEITQAEEILEYLERKEILNLSKPYAKEINGKTYYFKSLTDEQIKAVISVLDGKIKIKSIDDSYFLNAYENNHEKSMYERAGKQERQKTTKFFVSIAYKIILTIIVAVILAGLVPADNQGDARQILLDLMSRLFSLFSSLYWGYYVGNELVKYDAIFIDYKIQILRMFQSEIESGEFGTLTATQEAEKEYKEMKENEQR